MWLARGVQSAIFYYVACTPCLEADYKKKRKKEADRIQKEREALELEQPGIIQQPVPFQTNKYWAEEIAAGPGPPPGWTGHAPRTTSKKVNDKKTRRQSALAINLPSPTSGAAGLPSADVVAMQQEHNAKDSFRESFKAAISPEKWNWIRHERPDEILWGYEPLSRMLKGKGREGSAADPTSLSNITPGRSRSKTADSKVSKTSRDYAYIARNPEVNELHPPIVSKLPATRDEVAWMLQPPPPAAVMEGKVHPDSAPLPPRPLIPDPSPEKSLSKSRNRPRRSRPPAIRISSDSPRPSFDSPFSSRDSSPSQSRTRSSSHLTSNGTPITPKLTPTRRSRPPLATIVSFDSHKTPPSVRSSSWNAKSPETGALHTPPEWEFLMTQMYGPEMDGKVEYEAFGRYHRPGLERNRATRASWHGHERSWSDI